MGGSIKHSASFFPYMHYLVTYFEINEKFDFFFFFSHQISFVVPSRVHLTIKKALASSPNPVISFFTPFSKSLIKLLISLRCSQLSSWGTYKWLFSILKIDFCVQSFSQDFDPEIENLVQSHENLLSLMPLKPCQRHFVNASTSCQFHCLRAQKAQWHLCAHQHPGEAGLNSSLFLSISGAIGIIISLQWHILLELLIQDLLMVVFYASCGIFAS